MSSSSLVEGAAAQLIMYSAWISLIIRVIVSIPLVYCESLSSFVLSSEYIILIASCLKQIVEQAVWSIGK